jgi:hypothetical protein
MMEPSLFVLEVGPGGRDIVPPDWPIIAVRVDFLLEEISAGFSSKTSVLTEVVMPAGALLCTASGCGRISGWGRLDVNRDDPVELSLAADLQKAAISDVARSSCNTYTCQWNLFVAWCCARDVPRITPRWRYTYSRW